MRKQINILLVASLVSSVINLIPVSKVSAATVAASFTKVQANSNSAYLEFSVPMVDSDVLFKSGFESGDTKFTTTWTGDGNQSYVSTSDGHGTALQLTNTVSPESGNLYDPGLGQTSSKYSMAQIKIPSLRSNSKFSVQYDFKTTGTSGILSSFADLRKEQGAIWVDNSGNPLKFKNNVSFARGVTAPDEIPVYTDAGIINLPNQAITGETNVLTTSSNKSYDYGLIRYYYNASKQALIRHSSNTSPWVVNVGAQDDVMKNGTYTIAAGEAVRLLAVAGDYTAGDQTYNNVANWKTYNLNFDIPDTDYDFATYGAKQYVRWYTDGVSLLDNFKIGYAEKSILYRDGTQIYSGYDSAYTDTAATDKSKPGAISNLSYTFDKNRKTVTLGWASATDQGTDYTYTIQGQLRDGTVGSVQDPRTITIKSGIQGYIVQQDSNPSTSIESGQAVSSMGESQTSYTFTPEYGKKYIHVAALDNSGNIGPTQTIILVDSDQPQMSLTPSTTVPTRYGVTVTVAATDNTTWITQTQLPTGEVVNSGAASFIAEENGEYTVTSTDFLGNISQKTITISNIDQQSPMVAMTPDKVSWQPNDISVQVNVADNFPLTGLSLQYTVTNSLNYPDASALWVHAEDNPIQVQLPKEKEGQWYLHVKAIDQAGNEVLQTSGAYQIKSLPDSIYAEDIQVTSPTADTLKLIMPGQSDVGYTIEVDGKTIHVEQGNTSAIVNGLEPGIDHIITITPVNVSGKGEATTIRATTRPAEAQIIQVEPSSDRENRVTASVYAVNGAINYQYNLFDMQGSLIETRLSSNLKQDFDLQPNQRYELQVNAVNSAGDGLKTSRIFLTVPSLTGLAVTEVTEHSTSLQWNSVTGDTYYQLQRDHNLKIRVDHTVSQATYGTSEDVATFTDIELQPGTQYEYRVNAINESGSSIERNVTVQTLPAKPYVSAESVSDDRFILNITPVKSAESYDIYQDGVFFQRITDTQLQISNLLAGRQYSYQIAARNRSGLSTYQRLDILTQPERVEQPLLSNYTTSGVTMSFSSQPGVERWVVTDTHHSFESSNPIFDINELESGRTYTFTIYTENASGRSASQSVQVTTLPGKLQGASIREVTENDVTLVWQKLEGAISYEIHSNQGVIRVDGTEIKLPTPGPGIQTRYTITPIGKTGISPYTSTLLVIGSPKPPLLLSQQVISVTDITYYDAILSWVPFGGVHTYVIYDGEREIGRTTETQFVLNDLKSTTRYNQIYMIAENREGRRSSRYGVDFITLPDDRFSAEVSDVSASKVRFTFTGVTGNVNRIVELQDQKGWYEVYRGAEDTILIQSLSSNRRYSYRSWLENEQGGKSHLISGSFKTKEKQTEQEPISLTPTMVPQKSDLPDHSANHISTSDPEATLFNKSQIQFNDIDRSFAKESIIRLANMGIIQGISETEFAPQRGTTRAEFMAMIIRLGLSQEQINAAQATALTFKDTNDKNWYAKELKAAVHYHITEGYSYELFKPDEFINREQAAKMISVLLTQLHAQIVQTSEEYYTDSEHVSQWAKGNVNQLTAIHIIQGYQDRSFRPRAILTRAECTLMLDRVINQKWFEKLFSMYN